MAFADRIVLDELEQQLYDELSRMTIIDTHEHLKPEKQHLSKRFDWSWLLMGYLIHDLRSAGLDPKLDPWDNSTPPGRKWEMVKPYWQAVKWGTYARGLRLALAEWFGVDDITDDTWEMIGHKLNEHNKPGIYRKALAEKCRIERVICSNTEWTGYEGDLLRVIVAVPRIVTPADLSYYERLTGLPIRNAKQAYGALEKFFEDAERAGVVGFKTVACPMGPYDRSAVQRLLIKVGQGQALSFEEQPVMNRYFYELAFRLLRGTDKVVAVHCGVWGDFRTLDVMNFYQTIARFPGIKFDLFHMGMPSVRQMAFVGKNLRNASLNLCWSYLVSQHMAENALAEWLDIVPTTKVFGFGGDFVYNPQAVWGHLVMCRESLARVFAARIRRGMMDVDGAIAVLRAWMYENPKRYYGL